MFALRIVFWPVASAILFMRGGDPWRRIFRSYIERRQKNPLQTSTAVISAPHPPNRGAGCTRESRPLPRGVRLLFAVRPRVLAKRLTFRKLGLSLDYWKRAPAQFANRPSSSSYPEGHIDDLAAQVGNVLADVFGTELVCRTVEILRQLHADVVRAWLRAPVAWSADRLFATVNYWIDFTRHVLAESGPMCPVERRGGLSGAGGSSFAKGEAQQGARRGQRNRTQAGMMWHAGRL